MKNVISVECPLSGWPKGTEIRHFDDGTKVVVLPEQSREEVEMLARRYSTSPKKSWKRVTLRH